MGEIVAARGLSKVYGGLAAVDGVTFEVMAGEVFGLLGPNGAGKTTTLEIVEGLRQADSGEASLLGENPWPRNEPLLRRIGVHLQTSSFFERLTAREQIHTFAALYDVPAARADAMLDRVGLADKAATRTEKLSGGQKQRLSIACTLVHDPEVVFLDEPTASLDPQARRNLWDLLATLNDSGRTVVLTTHHLEEAEVLCDRVAVMDHGRIIETGSPAEMIRSLDAPMHVTVEGTELTRDEAARLPGVEAVEVEGIALRMATRDLAALLPALAERDALAGLQVRGATLEDVFLTLTGREYRT